jgi:hypothetical protein
VGIEEHGDLLASCIFSVVLLVVGSPKLALQVVVADIAAMLHTSACTSYYLSENMFTEESDQSRYTIVSI